MGPLRLFAYQASFAARAVPPVVFETVVRASPDGKPFASGHALDLLEVPVHPARPVRFVRERGLRFKREDLGSARRAMEHSVGQLSHLGVAALAGVGTRGVREAGYVPQGLERPAEQRKPAGAAASAVRPEEEKFPYFAERADDALLC